MTNEFKAGMEFAAQVAADCTAWYEGHGDKVGEIAAEEIRARINADRIQETEPISAIETPTRP